MSRDPGYPINISPHPPLWAAEEDHLWSQWLEIEMDLLAFPFSKHDRLRYVAVGYSKWRGMCQSEKTEDR